MGNKRCRLFKLRRWSLIRKVVVVTDKAAYLGEQSDYVQTPNTRLSQGTAAYLWLEPIKIHAEEYYNIVDLINIEPIPIRYPTYLKVADIRLVIDVDSDPTEGVIGEIKRKIEDDKNYDRES